MEEDVELPELAASKQEFGIEQRDVNKNEESFPFVKSRKWLQHTRNILEGYCATLVQPAVSVSEDAANPEKVAEAKVTATLTTPRWRAAFPLIAPKHTLDITGNNQRATFSITPSGVKLDSGKPTAETMARMVSIFKAMATPEQISEQKRAQNKRFVIVAPNENVAKTICAELKGDYTKLIDAIEIKDPVTGVRKEMTVKELLESKSVAPDKSKQAEKQEPIKTQSDAPNKPEAGVTRDTTKTDYFPGEPDKLVIGKGEADAVPPPIPRSGS